MKTNKMEKASVISRFNFGQEVWFLDGRHIVNAFVEGIKGENCCRYESSKIELKVYQTIGEFARTLWVKEEDCFESRQLLIDSILS